MIDYANESWQDYLWMSGADLIICDPEYDTNDRSFIVTAAMLLRPGGALWVFSDASGVAKNKVDLDTALEFQNWIVWPNDWGGRSKTRFGQKHDDILYYTKPGAEHTFNADAVAVQKKMTGATFNPSGRATKIPASVWNDLSGFSTVAKERIKIDGKCARWQKPEKIIERIVLATTNPGDCVFDFFSGVATVPAVCKRLERDCYATEIDPKVHKAGVARLKKVKEP
jgi:DNA modification methylase